MKDKEYLLELKLEMYNTLYEILLDYNFQIDLLGEKTRKFDLSDLETKILKLEAKLEFLMEGDK